MNISFLRCFGMRNNHVLQYIPDALSVFNAQYQWSLSPPPPPPLMFVIFLTNLPNIPLEDVGGLLPHIRSNM